MRDIKKLILEMTLEEKASLCSGSTFWDTQAVERLGIPAVMMSDGPHGLRKQPGEGDHLGVGESIAAVCFPAACATASSFDTELIQSMGETLGEECQAENLSVLLGPAVNIKRSPLCGRNFEYFSEDPYLTGEMAAAQIKGVQKWDVGTSMKHFAANNQEYNRMICSSEVDERTLREIYLTGFEKAVKQAQPKTIMCSYNKINGVFASENHYLLTEILRDEWGFEGCVVTDWGAAADRVEGIRAGLDLEMPGSNGVNDAKIAAAVRNGSLDEKLVDKAVENVLKMVFSYIDHRHPEAVFDREADHEKAIDAASQCAVLLKNDGVLPLKKDKKIAYIGEYADRPRFQGGGSSHINVSKVTSALASANEKGRNITYTKGFPFDADAMEATDINAAVAAARAADAAVIFAGLPDAMESEGYDRKNMDLPGCQNALIEAVCEVQKHVIVVLHNGSPVELPWADKVSGILEMYLGGQGVGEACDRLLYGEANPCGRLPESFPYRVEDNPSYINFPGDGKKVFYAEGVYVGYRYYEKKHLPVRYAFGHGLSYTTFEYSNLRVSSEEMNDDSEIVVNVDVKNIGDVAGKEVVQLYISDPAGQSFRPIKELKGFTKVLLQPGETKTASLTISARDLSYYNVEISDWYAPSGTYTILIGAASDDIKMKKDIRFDTAKQLPFVVTAETTLGDLMKNERTAPAVEELVQLIMANLMPAGADGEAQEGEKTLGADLSLMEMMMGGFPLKSLISFGSEEGEDLVEGLIVQLNQALGNED